MGRASVATGAPNLLKPLQNLERSPDAIRPSSQSVKGTFTFMKKENKAKVASEFWMGDQVISPAAAFN